MHIYDNYKIKDLLREAEQGREKQKLECKNKIVDNILWSLFAKCRAAPGQQEIVVSGYVLGDGVGDWFAMQNMCKHLQKKFPDRTVRLIAVSAEAHRDKLQAPKVRALDLTYFGDATAIGPSIPETLFAESDIHKKVKEAAVVIMGPIALLEFYDCIKDEISSKSIAFHEYDVNTNHDDISKRREGMGLGKKALGIFTNSIKKVYTWHDVENKHLKEVLFGDLNPSQQKIESYLSAHELFLGYMSNPKKLVMFINDAIAFAEEHASHKSVDVCCPFKGNIKEIERFIELYAYQFEKYGIGCIKIMSYKDDKEVVKAIQIGSGEKEVRIIDVGFLSGKDFKILTQISAPIVGCTGDGSIARVLSSGKIPYYEFKQHKEKFFNHLLSILAAEGDKSTHLLNYVEQAATGTGFTDELAQVSGLAEQAKVIGKVIRDHYSFNPIIKGIVNDYLYRQNDPEFAGEVDQIRTDYLSDTISVADVEERLIERLKAKELL